MFITIQDKCKIILEYFAMCTYSMHKIKTNTWVSFNFQPKARNFGIDFSRIYTINQIINVLLHTDPIS